MWNLFVMFVTAVCFLFLLVFVCFVMDRSPFLVMKNFMENSSSLSKPVSNFLKVRGRCHKTVLFRNQHETFTKKKPAWNWWKCSQWNHASGAHPLFVEVEGEGWEISKKKFLYSKKCWKKIVQGEEWEKKGNQQALYNITRSYFLMLKKFDFRYFRN